MAFIKLIEINQFRGIRKLTVSDFSSINLIVGDNNSGKTTFLEAIQLLFAKSQLSSIKSVIDRRTILKPNSSFYHSFIKMFNLEQSKKLLDFDIYANSDKGPLRFELKGNERAISGEDALQLSTMSLRQKAQYKRAVTFLPETVKVFTGSIVTQEGKKTVEKEICCTSLDNGIARSIEEKEVHYIPSFGHLCYDLLQNIVDNPE